MRFKFSSYINSYTDWPSTEWKIIWWENLNTKIWSISNEYYPKQTRFCSNFDKNVSVHTSLIAGPIPPNYMQRWLAPTSALMSRHLPTLLPIASSFINREELTGVYNPHIILLWIYFWSFLQLSCKKQCTVSTFYTHVSLQNMTEISFHLSELQAIISIIFWVAQPVLTQTSLNK